MCLYLRTDLMNKYFIVSMVSMKHTELMSKAVDKCSDINLVVFEPHEVFGGEDKPEFL